MYIHFAPNPNDCFFSSPPEDIKSPMVYVNTLVDASNNPEIKSIINEAIPRTLTNKEIAASLGVSVRTAETTFKNCFDMTIHQYLIRRRVELAKFWLKFFPEQKNSVTASGLGFFDEYHFSKQFRKITGISPTEYKNIFIQ